MNTTHIVLVSITFVGLFSIEINCLPLKLIIGMRETQKKSLANYYTKPHDVLQLYQMTKDFHEVLQIYGIKYWIHAGTLLGAVRHQGLMPWDDDVDICIDKKDSEFFFKLKSVFNQLEYELIPFVFGYKLFPKNGIQTPYTYKYPWIDIMVWTELNEKFMYDPDRKPGPWYDSIFIYKTDLFPLKLYSFGGISLWGPCNPEPYLNYVYPGWKNLIRIYNHAISLNYSIPLSEENKHCAKPTGPLIDKIIPKS